MRISRASIALAAAVLAALCAALPASAPARRAPFVAHLHAPTHSPRAHHAWRITITARTHRGSRLSGRVRYEYLYGGQVVARRSNYRFTRGVFHDTITWPSTAIGYRLVFRAVVSTRLGVVRLPYAVKVRR